MGFSIFVMWWDLIPDVDCSGIEREHCSVDAAPSGYVMVGLTCYRQFLLHQVCMV